MGGRVEEVRDGGGGGRRAVTGEGIMTRSLL